MILYSSLDPTGKVIFWFPRSFIKKHHLEIRELSDQRWLWFHVHHLSQNGWTSLASLSSCRINGFLHMVAQVSENKRKICQTSSKPAFRTWKTHFIPFYWLKQVITPGHVKEKGNKCHLCMGRRHKYTGPGEIVDGHLYGPATTLCVMNPGILFYYSIISLCLNLFCHCLEW